MFQQKEILHILASFVISFNSSLLLENQVLCLGVHCFLEYFEGRKKKLDIIIKKYFF